MLAVLGDVLPVPYMLKGGLNFPQSVRTTTDADIQTPRPVLNREMQMAMIVAGAFSRARAFTIRSVSPEPQSIDVGYGYRIEATCGTNRGNTHIHVSSGCGPDAFPHFVPENSYLSLVRDCPPLVCRSQAFESMAAEKLLAILTQTDDDRRVKHHPTLL